MSLINDIIEEWAYRVDNGMPNPKNSKHLDVLSSVLTEMGLHEIKNELIQNLTEADKQFSNPLLNKIITYKNEKGEQKKAPIGNLLRLAADHPGRKAAEAMLPKDGTPERKALNKSLGSEKGGKSVPSPYNTKKDGDTKPKPTDGGEDKPKEEPQQNPMFDPKVDPAMAARIDTEKQTLAKLAKGDESDEPAKLEPISGDPNSKAKQFKGKLSGKDIQTIPMEGGGQIYGTVHRNKKMVDDIINDIKANIPEEKWKDIVFVGEGGSTGKNGEIVFHDEMKYAAPKFKELGAGIDTFDGDELDVHNDQSKLYKRQMEKTGLNQSQVNAGNWASMIGQGEGTDTMSPDDYLDAEGKKFIQDEAINAGFPPIENWNEPTDKDIDTLYRLSFPEDYGDKETKINDIQVAFNEIRDESIIEKTKELQSQGKIPITIAGESHVELVDKMMQKSSKPDSDFQPVEPTDVTKKMPKADSAAFSGQSDIDKLTKQERKEISMKIDELNKMTQDAIEKGEKAPNYNLCKVTVPGTNLYCDNNLGIPREDMPQFKGKPQPGTPAADMPVDKNGEVDTEPLFKQMLADRGIKVLDTEIPSDSLKATQSELVGSKVAGMTKALEKDPNHPSITAPIYVSRDGYVVDGHHRWAAVTSAAIKAGKPADMKVRVIDMDAKDIIPMANKFAEEQGVAAKKADANQEGPKSDIVSEPKVADEKGTTAKTPSGKTLYSVGGGYYSDKPNGEPKFIRTETIAKKAFFEGDEKAFLLIFEAEFTADVEGGKSGKFKEIKPEDRKDAAEDLKDINTSTDTTAQKPTKKQIINGKDKTLSTENPLETEEYQKELEPNDDDFAKKNEKFANPIPPQPYKLPNSILNNPKFPKRYYKLLERFMNTKPIGNAKKISHYSDFPGGAGKLPAQAGELLTMIGVTLTDAEFDELQKSISAHLTELTTQNPELKKDGTRIVNAKWLKAAANNRKAIFKKIAKQFPGYRIGASSWDTKNEVEALGMASYNNKGYSTDIYLRLESDSGEPLLCEISLKQNLKVNLLNSGTGKFFEWLGKDNVPDNINPQKFAKTEREKLANFCKENIDAIKELVNSDEALKAAIEEKGIDFQTALLETLKGKGNRDKTKILLEATKALQRQGNENAKNLIDDLDNDHANYVSEAINAVVTNPKLKEGMLNEIKNEFPLKSVADNEESVVLGEYTLDKSTMEAIFGTSDFNEFKEGLISQPGPPPFIAYKVKLGGRVIPIANIDIREDGRNYGGQFKFEMTVNDEFAKEIIKANREVYGK